MFARFSAWLGSIAKGWLVLVLFVIEIAFMGFILPGAQARIESFSGGIGPLDLTFFPSAQQALAAIAAYGNEGRTFYATIELTADILYPIAYTFFYSLLITLLLRAAFDQNSSLQRLNLLPFGAWLFDLLENVCILTLLFSYPAQSSLVASALTIMNGIKWLFAGASILALLFALGAWVFKKVSAK